MQTQAVKLTELFNDFEAALIDYGLGFGGRLSTLKCVRSVMLRHEKLGLMYLDKNIVANHLNDIEERFYAGKIKRGHYDEQRRSADRFINFAETGSVALPNPLKGSRTPLIPEYQQIADNYLSSGDFHPNTRNDMRWIAHKYFNWLTENGHYELRTIGTPELQRFLIECSKLLAPGSMHNVKLYMKKLYAYLYEEGLAPSSYESLLAFPVNRESKIYPALSMTEVNKLLDSIDRRTKQGKRAYAIMILGAELGLRACDVVALKLSNIDWVRGEIKIVQSKTSKPLALPLTKRVGEALQDYILNVRAKTDAQRIFLRLNHPYSPLVSAVTLGEIYRDCCKVAGIQINKAYHTLRRSLATAMVTNGVDVMSVVQVLGGDDMDSVKKYISLDTAHLKMCALPFDGITPKGGRKK
jgi:site-specific recombinase XerD